MRSGELRQRVTLQRPVYAVNAAGDSVITGWQDIGTFPARVRHVTTAEADRFARLQTVVTHHVTMRWLPGVNGTMRLVWGCKILAIAEFGVDPTARRQLNMKCTELMPDTASDDPGSASASGSGSDPGSTSASGSASESGSAPAQAQEVPHG